MAYYGRTGGLAVSPTDVVRPRGIYPGHEGERARLHPTRKLDFELELAFFISAPIPQGTIVTAKDAAEHIFGFVLLNDWSARDIQKHEMAPLGVFHSKSFQTSISPWIITLDALRGSSAGPPKSNQTKIESLLVCDDQDHGVFDLELSAKVSRGGAAAVTICESNAKHAYWSPYQMLAYHSLSGVGVSTGDLLGTGTHSSPISHESATPSTGGCLVEVFGLGETLPDVGGQPMGWLEDGDRLTIEAWFKTAAGGRAGFGPLTGLVCPSLVESAI
ncbi:uncharacterized protein A1O9_07500 [Exophiala aquamarina CBS 119918]|uniref:Fumarylacetoacetase n=1 Tax=Exophiala aquamarina CBS 119918 TaxID=1182545 RepID=A0A072PK77_9EURO|nr:uncharacterized protein A1O9_07500 [Exophiala aquamarina CBS 119918]KEF55920.1 hypothetical protein A1O9_07500 [Exophiala aquamarina CBS 119918]